MKQPVQGINHLGIAVRSIAESRQYYEQTLGALYEGEEEVAAHKVRIAFFRVGDVRLELLEPTAPDSPIARYIERRGEGVHHVAFTVEDLSLRIVELQSEGLRMLDEKPRPGAHSSQVAFVDPRSAHGVLTELTEPIETHRAPVVDRIRLHAPLQKRRDAAFTTLTPEEAAAHIHHGMTLACGGFTAAGAPKAVPRALAQRAREIHAAGKPFKIRLLTGASTGPDLDQALAEAEAIAWRAPYQSSKALRGQLNCGETDFVDLHLSHLPQMVSGGFLGKIDVAVVEATDVTPDGRVFLTSGVGAAPSFLAAAEKVIIEINRYHSPRVSRLSDIAILPNPPHRRAIPLYHPMDRIGWPYASVDPEKIIGIVEHEQPDGIAPPTPPDPVSRRIADNFIRCILAEQKAGRIPPEFLPLQSGVGNIANAVLAGLDEHPDCPPFYMFTEVLQDSVVGLLESGNALGASTCSLTVSAERLRHIYDNMDFFEPRIILRPQEISNNPGLVRRLGVITTNTALEVDIYGHVNSTHVGGTYMMNGIGGSGDFTRNAYLSFFMCPSIAKGGRISTIVPMVTHVDHTEHSVQFVITEQGFADLRGLAPLERARTLIDRCAHPAYRDYLHRYLESAPPGHIRHDLDRCFDLHRNLRDTGRMLPELGDFE